MLFLEIWGYCILLGNWGLFSGFSVSKGGLRKGLSTILLEVKQANKQAKQQSRPAGHPRSHPEEKQGNEKASKLGLFKLGIEAWQVAQRQKGGSLRLTGEKKESQRKHT